MNTRAEDVIPPSLEAALKTGLPDITAIRRKVIEQGLAEQVLGGPEEIAAAQKAEKEGGSPSGVREPPILDPASPAHNPIALTTFALPQRF